jgi:hypothetical protein
MVSKASTVNAKVLRKHVSAFLGSRAPHRAPLLNILERVIDQGFPSVLFGGTLRDMTVYGPSKDPRDVDVVVDGASIDTLAKLFADVLVRKTRFGGLHLNSKGWMIDIWPLNQTWAVRERRAGEADFEALTRTTFLNVEAVAVELKEGRRQVYSSGFFEAVGNRVLDINLEENPFPELASIRTLLTAAKFQYSMSKRLARYVVYHTNKIPLEQMVSIQLSHYGIARLNEDRINHWMRVLSDQLATGSSLRVPALKPTQLTLWDSSKEATQLENDHNNQLPIPA